MCNISPPNITERQLSNVPSGSSLFSGDVDPHKFHCNNCARLEKQVKKPLDDLHSAQLIIEFIQDELNK
jgi:hypothetical protein